jgi:dTDP-4-dehydrorhamnose reductase
MRQFKKVFITGAEGTLGTELQKQLNEHNISYVAVDREIDVCHYDKVFRSILNSKADVVIHCAAMTDVARCEIERDRAYQVNVIGTTTVAEVCYDLGKFMLCLSSDYVYKGDKPYTGDGKEGNYEVHDRLDPINYYSFTKAVGDTAVQQRLPYSSLIVRTSFKKKGPWPYPKAFIDQYTSRDTVDVIADQILQCLFGSHTGVVHLGTERKTVYELAKRQSPEVEPISIEDIKDVVLPRDTSLKLTTLGPRLL